MTEPVVLPGPREVRGQLDRPDTDRVVVACPPHPQHGGSRSDPRLRAVSDALAPDVACLRFDYGPWSGGADERRDAADAVAWARNRFDSVALFGYSFGAGVALRVAAATPDLAVCSALAPPSNGGAAVSGLEDVGCQGQVVYGERDDTADWRSVVARARDLDWRVDALPADHHFVGRFDRVGEFVATGPTATEPGQ